MITRVAGGESSACAVEAQERIAIVDTSSAGRNLEGNSCTPDNQSSYPFHGTICTFIVVEVAARPLKPRNFQTTVQVPAVIPLTFARV